MDPKSDIKVASAVQGANTPEDDTITLSTGVVLRGKMVPSMLLIKIMANFPRPKPPVWTNPIMGREMENPDDPNFIESVKAWKMEMSNATLNVMILMGTELVRVPKGMSKPDDDVWLESYRLLGIPMYPANKHWRYLSWITFTAAPEMKDLDKIKEVVGRLSGVPESKVDAAESFPGSDQQTG